MMIVPTGADTLGLDAHRDRERDGLAAAISNLFSRPGRSCGAPAVEQDGLGGNELVA